MSTQREHLKGFFYGFLFALFSAAIGFIVKKSEAVPISTFLFFRSLIALSLISLPFLIKKKLALKTEKLPLHLFRAVMGLTAIFCYYYTVRSVDLVEAIVYFNTAPLFTPLVIYLWLGKKISRRRFFTLVVGFIGVLIMMDPGRNFHPKGLVGLGTGLAGAIIFVALRKLSRTEDTRTILFYFFATSFILMFFPMLYFWEPLTRGELISVISLGICTYFLQFTKTKAVTHVPASKVSIMTYFTVLFGGIIGWVYFKEVPALLTIFGMLLVILAGISMILEKR